MASSGTQPGKEAIVMPSGTATTGQPLNIYGDVLYFKITEKRRKGDT
jgi:hypothetical protein